MKLKGQMTTMMVATLNSVFPGTHWPHFEPYRCIYSILWKICKWQSAEMFKNQTCKDFQPTLPRTRVNNIAFYIEYIFGLLTRIIKTFWGLETLCSLKIFNIVYLETHYASCHLPVTRMRPKTVLLYILASYSQFYLSKIKIYLIHFLSIFRQ